MTLTLVGLSFESSAATLILGAASSQMHIYPLPAKIFEANLPKMLCDLAEIERTDGEVVLDFSRVEYWIPAAVVLMCSMVNRWTLSERVVQFRNHLECSACTYLQRMDFFDRVGMSLPEHFRRHDPGTSFVEIQQVYPAAMRYHDPLARRLAECLSGTQDGTDDVLRLSEYALGEVIGNCQQHAEKPGFVSAQYVQSRDWARIGMADYGIGILESFKKHRSPHYFQGMTHAQALECAMRPWVSSKRHLVDGPYAKSANKGIGLTMVRNMLASTNGHLFVASGDAWLRFERDKNPESGTLTCGNCLPGTIISIGFSRGQVDNFREILSKAQSAINLTPEPDDDNLFV